MQRNFKYPVLSWYAIYKKKLRGLLNSKYACFYGHWLIALGAVIELGWVNFSKQRMRNRFIDFSNEYANKDFQGYCDKNILPQLFCRESGKVYS